MNIIHNGVSNGTLKLQLLLLISAPTDTMGFDLDGTLYQIFEVRHVQFNFQKMKNFAFLKYEYAQNSWPVTSSIICTSFCIKYISFGRVSAFISHEFQDVTLYPGHCDTLPRVWGKVSQKKLFTRNRLQLRRQDLEICYRTHFVASIHSFHLYQVVFKKID